MGGKKSAQLCTRKATPRPAQEQPALSRPALQPKLPALPQSKGAYSIQPDEANAAVFISRPTASVLGLL